MTQFLPPNLLALFAPRDPIPYLPPPDKLPYEKKTTGYTGVSMFLHNFEDPKDTPPPVRIETREERQERKRREKAEQVAYKLEQDIALWAPQNNAVCTSDAFKTLFVARVNYNTSESKLRREFEMYGPIKKIYIVHDKFSGKPRGYAFIEYERDRDMHSAYKHADGKKIDGRRVLVDVERGRTVKGWLPRRLGGGLGGTRRGGPEVNVKHSGREESRLDDRYIDRDRGERPERPERRRSRSRERRRRSRSRSRDRHRVDRHKRGRSRDRERPERNDRNDRGGRDREPVDIKPDITELMVDMPPEGDRKERRRSRSRDRDRRRRRSRSRDRGDKDKRRERERDRDGRVPERGDKDDRMEHVTIKVEPPDPDEVPQDNNYNSGYGNMGYNYGGLDGHMDSSQY